MLPDLTRQAPQSIDRQPVAHDFGYRSRRPADGDDLRFADVPFGQEAPRVLPQRLELLIRRRVLPHKTFRGAVGAQWQRDSLSGPAGGVAEDELRGAAPEVDDEHPPFVAHGREGAAKTEGGLLLARDQTHLQTGRFPHASHEFLAVLGGARVARGEYLRRGCPVHGGYAGEQRDRLRCEHETSLVEAARLLHAGPEPGRDLLARYGQDGPVVHLADEEMDGVRTYVHNRMPA